MWQSRPRQYKPLIFMGKFFRLKNQQVCTPLQARLALHFLHKFCGQYCAQGQRSVRKALIYKGKLPLPVFWAHWRLSTADGLKCPRRRIFNVVGWRSRICFKGMHINCGKRCAQTTEPLGKSLIYMRTTCRA